MDDKRTFKCEGDMLLIPTKKIKPMGTLLYKQMVSIPKLIFSTHSFPVKLFTQAKMQMWSLFSQRAYIHIQVKSLYK